MPTGRGIIQLIQCRKLSYKTLVTWYSSLVKPKPRDPPFNHIVQIGDPTLRATCEDIPIDLIQSPEVQYLINQLKTVMRKYNCVGLSAPQIGTPLQLIMIEFNEKHAKYYGNDEFKRKEMSLVPLMTVINPVIKITDYSKIIYTESCQSVKGFYADVPRFRSLELKGFDENAKPITKTASGWTARIIQHEIDHLNGTIYTDKMDRKTLTCSCWETINARQGKVELPYHHNI